jgi:hypothetical protein
LKACRVVILTPNPQHRSDRQAVVRRCEDQSRHDEGVAED